MTPEEEALRGAIQVLDRLGIPYMLTGPVATSYHGRPRTTHDADGELVDKRVEPSLSIQRPLSAKGFYVDADSARDALHRRRQFNVIEMQQASKIERMNLAFASGVAIVTPEDAILSKLEWARRSGESERQLRDPARAAPTRSPAVYCRA
jgi:hypothetical protein